VGRSGGAMGSVQTVKISGQRCQRLGARSRRQLTGGGEFLKAAGRGAVEGGVESGWNWTMSSMVKRLVGLERAGAV